MDLDNRFEASPASSAREILSAVKAHRAEVVVISAIFDEASANGLQIARKLTAEFTEVHLIILLEASTPESVINSFRCGAKGVFSRNRSLTEFRGCIERVCQGEIWANETETGYLLQAVRNTPSCEGVNNHKISSLSRRQVQVAELAAQGFSNKQIVINVISASTRLRTIYLESLRNWAFPTDLNFFSCSLWREMYCRAKPKSAGPVLDLTKRSKLISARRGKVMQSLSSSSDSRTLKAAGFSKTTIRLLLVAGGRREIFRRPTTKPELYR